MDVLGTCVRLMDEPDDQSRYIKEKSVMLKKTSVLILLLSLLAIGVGVDAAPGNKSGGTAMLLSGLLLPGGGQIYCGETGRGLAILAGEVAIALMAGGRTDNGRAFISTEDTTAVIALSSLHIWQIMDAKDAAHRANMSPGVQSNLAASDEHRELPSVTFDLNVIHKSVMVKKTFRF